MINIGVKGQVGNDIGAILEINHVEIAEMLRLRNQPFPERKIRLDLAPLRIVVPYQNRVRWEDEMNAHVPVLFEDREYVVAERLLHVRQTEVGHSEPLVDIGRVDVTNSMAGLELH